MRSHSGLVALLAVLSLVCSSAASETNPLVRPLLKAHAHNDYLHPRPLFDALDRGFCGIEADVFLVNGELLVAHEREEIIPERTLEALYLEPLAKLIREGAVRMHGRGSGLTLLIDVKSEAEATWEAIRAALRKHRWMLTRFHGSRIRKGPLTVLISGNRAASLMLAEEVRLAGLDGRLPDVNLGLGPHIMPLLSDDWKRFFTWAAQGPIPEKELEQLKAIVEQVHSAGFRLRFWNTPDSPACWEVLNQVGVDVIGTDDLDGLSRFFTELAAKSPRLTPAAN